VRREKPIASVVEEVLRKVIGESPQPAAPAAPAPAAPVEDPFIATMLQPEKEAYELAKWAEGKGDEYKGLSGKFLNFYKAVDQYVNTERQKDPNRSFDDDDEAFQTFVQGARPEIAPAAWDKLKTDRLIAQVEESTTQKVTEKFTKQTEEIQKRQDLMEKRPIIEGRLGAFQSNVGKLMASDPASPIAEIAKAIETNGIEKATEADPLFVPIVVKAYGHGERAAAEFLAMAHGVKDYNPQDPVQDWVIRFIRRAGETFANNGGDKRLRNGEDGTAQSFLPRGKYNELQMKNPAEAAKHWTFSDEDVLAMMERNTRDHIDALVKAERERLTKAGYIKPPPATPPPPVPGAANPPPTPGAATPPPEPVGSPRAGVSAAPGQGAGSVGQQHVMSNSELQILGLPARA
jgi:hypothetical protein